MGFTQAEQPACPNFGHGRRMSGSVMILWCGEPVHGVELGGKLARVTFSLGTVPISVGLGLGGSVSYRTYRVSAPRRAVVLAAGPVANILAASCCLLLPLPHWEASYLGLWVLASAVQDLAPGHGDDGNMTDGYKLLRIPVERRAAAEVRKLLADPGWRERPDAGGILIDGFRLGAPEAEDCLRELSRQPSELLCMFTKAADLDTGDRAKVLALVAMARHSLLLSGRQQLDEAAPGRGC